MPELGSRDELEATTHAEVVDERAPRTVRLRLEAVERVPAHHHPESNVVLHLLEGAVALTLGDDVSTLESGISSDSMAIRRFPRTRSMTVRRCSSSHRKRTRSEHSVPDRPSD